MITITVNNIEGYSHFFSKKFQHICVSLDVNLNESLTNDIVSFEQLGLECQEAFAQEVTVNEKLCKNIALNLQATYVLDICKNCRTEAMLTNIQNIYSIKK